jgi:hypothetical protein
MVVEVVALRRAPAIFPVGESNEDRLVTACGIVSRVTPVHTAVRNCTRDEGGPLRGRQSGVDLKPPQAAVVKSNGGERCGKVGTRFRQV